MINISAVRKKILVLLAVTISGTANLYCASPYRLRSPKTILQNDGITVTGIFELYSHYLWRGIVLDSEPVLQHGFSLSKYGCTLTYWANWDFLDKTILNSNELDFAFEYSKSLQNITLSAGTVYYSYLGMKKYDKEVFAKCRLEQIPLAPTILAHFDYDTGKLGYWSLDLIRDYMLDKKKDVSAGFELHTGFSNDLLIDGSGGDFALTGKLGFHFTKTIDCSLILGYDTPFNSTDIPSIGYRRPQFYEGLRIGTSFS